MRLNITVEGQTEEAFVGDVLAPYLGHRGVYAVARRVLTGMGRHPIDGSRGYQFRGGMDDYAKPRRDIVIWMRQDRGQDVRFTTMFDLYGLPSDWPGRLPEDERPCTDEYIIRLESAFAKDIGDRRFIPYIQIHEFEALVLSDPHALLKAHPDASAAVNGLHEVVAECGGPELVNDGAETHPARRICEAIPLYRKTLSGLSAALAIGIERMRECCPHFDEWVEKLVALAEE